MKHLKMLLCILLPLYKAIGLSGCGNDRQNAGSETGQPPISETEESQISEIMSEAADKTEDTADGSVADSNMIIEYFSRANNAEEYNLENIGVDVLGHASVVAPGDAGRIAEYIEERTGAVFKTAPVCRAEEMNVRSLRFNQQVFIGFVKLTGGITDKEGRFQDNFFDLGIFAFYLL